MQQWDELDKQIRANTFGYGRPKRDETQSTRNESRGPTTKAFNDIYTAMFGQSVHAGDHQRAIMPESGVDGRTQIIGEKSYETMASRGQGMSGLGTTSINTRRAPKNKRNTIDTKLLTSRSRKSKKTSSPYRSVDIGDPPDNFDNQNNLQPHR